MMFTLVSKTIKTTQHHMVMYNHLFWLVVSASAFIFPSIIPFCLLLFIVFPIEVNKVDIKAFRVLLPLFMAAVASGYERLNGTGDISKYIISFDYMNPELFFSLDHSVAYYYVYPVWYLLNAVVKSLGFSFEVVTFTCIYVAYYCLFKTLSSSFSERKNILIIMAFICLLFSFPIVFSSYRTVTCLSIIGLGLAKVINDNSRGWFLCIIGLGIHPIGLVPIAILILSKFIVPSKKLLLVSIFLGLVMKPILIHATAGLQAIPIIGGKISMYISGEWGSYRFHEAGEYLLFLQLLLFSLFLIFMVMSSNKFNINFNFQSPYLKFCFTYLCIVFMFMSFRTIFIRLQLSGIVFFIPLLMYALRQNLYSKKLLVILFLFVCIDIRTFMFFNYTSYQIGDGFPANILQPYIIELIGKNIS